MTILQVLENKTGRSQTAATALQGERSRARKSAEHRIQAERPGQHEQLRRAVDCAPYLTFFASGQICRAAILAAGLLRPWTVAGLWADWHAAILAAVLSR